MRTVNVEKKRVKPQDQLDGKDNQQKKVGAGSVVVNP